MPEATHMYTIKEAHVYLKAQGKASCSRPFGKPAECQDAVPWEGAVTEKACLQPLSEDPA